MVPAGALHDAHPRLMTTVPGTVVMYHTVDEQLALYFKTKNGDFILVFYHFIGDRAT